ncbi:MAG TPA: SRPBCC family protein [Microbacteriaceae bacterium]|nr:SRPBCC family protein [Microbacteriaceae bacterium]
MTRRWRLSSSIEIARDAQTLYQMVADVTRMGEWSPVNTGGRWESDERGVGALFTGRNETPGRTWETHCEVIVATPGREFAFAVGGARTRWGYTFEKTPSGTRVTESWEVPEESMPHWQERFGETTQKELGIREQAAREGMPATLAALKRVAEAAPAA